MTDESQDDEIYNGDNADKSPDNVDEDSSIDYGEEVSNIEEMEKERESNDGDSIFVNLPEGKTELKFLDDGTKTTVNFGTEDNPDLQDKVMYEVEVVDGNVVHKDEDNNEIQISEDDMEDYEDTELIYSVTEASTKASQWGQIARVGQDRQGLKGESLTFVRTGTGTDTNYTVLEAADLE